MSDELKAKERSCEPGKIHDMAGMIRSTIILGGKIADALGGIHGRLADEVVESIVSADSTKKGEAVEKEFVHV